MEEAARRSLVQRMIGAALLDSAVYEEVEADEEATVQAGGVVLLAALASAIAGAVGAGADADAAALGAGALFVIGLVGGIVGWVLWSGVTLLIGTRVLGGTATWGELLRTIGFAQAPGILGVLGALPGAGVLVQLAVTLWVLVAGVIAIRQALDFSTGKAILTAVLGWLAMAAGVILLGTLAATLVLRG